MELDLASDSNWREFVATPMKVFGRLVGENQERFSANRDPLEVHRLFRQLAATSLEDEKRREEIPSIDGLKSLDTIVPNSLVRFRCMVQDMFDPEYFLALYETNNTGTHEKSLGLGLYRDSLEDTEKCLEINYDSSDNLTLDRMSYFCISIPGENEWINKGNKPPSAPVAEEAAAAAAASDTDVKRRLDEEKVEPSTEGVAEKTEPKKLKRDEENAPEAATADLPPEPLTLDRCFPVRGEKSMACLVKVYDTTHYNLKLNDVIEVVGVINFDTVHLVGEENLKAAVLENGSGDVKIDDVNAMIGSMGLEEEEGVRFPRSLVPHIHAFHMKPLKHINPLPVASTPDAVNKEFMVKIRSELHALLSQCLFGDTIAADYLICHLVSQIYMRKDVMALGSFPLGLSNFPKMTAIETELYIQSLFKLLSKITTHSVYFPLSLETLNGGNLVPRKDYVANKLIAGRLQLPQHTLLLVDETALKVGKLTAEGVKSLAAVGELIRWQKLNYDFKFHQMEMETDINSLVVSEGKSLLPVGCRMPLKGKSNISVHEMFTSIEEYLSEELLNQIRCYITVTRGKNYDISEQVQKIVQEDFVEMRQITGGVINSDDLHLCLTLSRLLALSYGESELTEDVWRKSKAMEMDRKLRL